MHEDPHFEYFYYEVENIEDIAKRWREYNETQILDTVRDLALLCAMRMITEQHICKRLLHAVFFDFLKKI